MRSGLSSTRRSFLARCGVLTAATVIGAGCAPARPGVSPTPTPAASPTPATATLGSVATPSVTPASPTPAASPAIVASPTPAVAVSSPTTIPAIEQFRAFWVDAFHSGFKSPAEVDLLVDDARACGVNTLLVEVRRRADEYFNRGSEPRADDPDLVPGFDALQYLLDRARKGDRPLQVHAWTPTLPVWRRDWPVPSDPAHVFNRHGPKATGRDNWLTWDNTGKQFDGDNYALDPGHPDAADYAVAAVTDIARNYDVDGIHLDYVRYAKKEWGYNPVNVARFNQQTGRRGQPAVDDPAWSDWRRAQVSAVVRRIYLDLLRIRPSLQLTAALIAWGTGPVNPDDEAGYKNLPAYSWVYQDWQGWLAEGILDQGVLMAYYEQDRSKYPHGYEEWTDYALAHQGRRRMNVGPGIFTNTIAGSLAQIQHALAQGAPGISLYSYATFARDPATPRSALREMLVGGPGPTPEVPPPFATPAVAPVLPWKSSAPEAHLAGRVLGADGKPLDGGRVVLRGPTQRELVADASGYFGAIALPPGDYQVALANGGTGASSAATVRPGEVASVELRRTAV